MMNRTLQKQLSEAVKLLLFCTDSGSQIYLKRQKNGSLVKQLLSVLSMACTPSRSRQATTDDARNFLPEYTRASTKTHDRQGQKDLF